MNVVGVRCNDRQSSFIAHSASRRHRRTARRGAHGLHAIVALDAVGRWTDDYTFVAQTVGLDERTWLDNVGRPHSLEARVEERYVRRDAVHIDVTITIDDPVYYSKPWVALDRLPLRLQPDTFDIREMECSPSEFARYTKEFAEPAAAEPAK